MKAKFLDSNETYDGSQLNSLRNYLRFQLLGDSVVSWVGPCDIDIQHMVDGEDYLNSARICGDEMLHFIVEKFDCSLLVGVCLQRLLASIVADELRSLCQNKKVISQLIRKGDDLYINEKKLSISVAAQSPSNTLIHFAINVVNSGTPVPTMCLKDLEIQPAILAHQVMLKFCEEVESIIVATHKVRWVR